MPTEWDEPFAVLTFTRSDLERAGIRSEKAGSLSDHEMGELARSAGRMLIEYDRKRYNLILVSYLLSVVTRYNADKPLSMVNAHQGEEDVRLLTDKDMQEIYPYRERLLEEAGISQNRLVQLDECDVHDIAAYLSNLMDLSTPDWLWNAVGVVSLVFESYVNPDYKPNFPAVKHLQERTA